MASAAAFFIFCNRIGYLLFQTALFGIYGLHGFGQLGRLGLGKIKPLLLIGGGFGQRGLTTYTVVKPFATGELIELTNGQGQPLGKKAAYGEEYNSIYTPKVLRGGCTSIVVYSATARAAL